MSSQVGIGSLGGTVFFQVGLCKLWIHDQPNGESLSDKLKKNTM